jgi:hypothetical protein
MTRGVLNINAETSWEIVASCILCEYFEIDCIRIHLLFDRCRKIEAAMGLPERRENAASRMLIFVFSTPALTTNLYVPCEPEGCRMYAGILSHPRELACKVNARKDHSFGVWHFDCFDDFTAIRPGTACIAQSLFLFLLLTFCNMTQSP